MVSEPPMTDRLTIAAARPGVRVRCVDDSAVGSYDMVAGRIYVVRGPWSPGSKYIEVEGITAPWHPARFVPADEQPTLAALLAERAPEFLAAVRECHRVHNDCMRWSLCEPLRSLLAAIERAGLIAQEPRTTEREATIREWWWT